MSARDADRLEMVVRIRAIYSPNCTGCVDYWLRGERMWMSLSRGQEVDEDLPGHASRTFSNEHSQTMTVHLPVASMLYGNCEIQRDIHCQDVYVGCL